ncbi:MAG: hypothetical protein M1819_002963 [Sarea resinae]|nr:MAG: hypothetical protein M1819_002963 [Sarea resinae]
MVSGAEVLGEQSLGSNKAQEREQESGSGQSKGNQERSNNNNKNNKSQAPTLDVGARGGKGGKRGRQGRGGRDPLPRDVQVSKAMSRILRHDAVKEGLRIDEGGWVGVADLLACNRLKQLKVTFEELKAIVADNDKQRFAMVPIVARSPSAASVPSSGSASASTSTPLSAATLTDPNSPSSYLIRASQGHSLALESSALLTPITLENAADLCIHGTTTAAWPLILHSGGLSRMKRTHIHFASGLPSTKPPKSSAAASMASATTQVDLPLVATTITNADIPNSPIATTDSNSTPTSAAPVISGMRLSSQIHIYVSLRRALSSGLKFWRSENGVLLTEGDETGMLPLEFFDKVVDVRKNGVGVLWEKGKGEVARLSR